MNTPNVVLTCTNLPLAEKQLPASFHAKPSMLRAMGMFANRALDSFSFASFAVVRAWRVSDAGTYHFLEEMRVERY